MAGRKAARRSRSLIGKGLIKTLLRDTGTFGFHGLNFLLCTYGWTSDERLPWIVPALDIGCVGIGIYSLYLAVVIYLAHGYEKYAASALSAASLSRNRFGAFLPLATPALYGSLGFQWASSYSASSVSFLPSYRSFCCSKEKQSELAAHSCLILHTMRMKQRKGIRVSHRVIIPSAKPVRCYLGAMFVHTRYNEALVGVMLLLKAVRTCDV